MNRVDEAFRKTPRHYFLPTEEAGSADLDMPLPIGYGQTNSQPYTVRLMLEWLDVHPGQKILDVGSGSGWTTALLSHLTGPKGRVVAVEKVPELVKFGEENCKRLKLKNVEFYEAGSVYGWPDVLPYDRILVSASAHRLPEELIEQLAPSGRMVIPVQSSILIVQKAANGSIDVRENPGFAFVPLV